MATPTVTVTQEALTGDQNLDAMTSGYRWVLGADRTIDWSLSSGFSGEAWGDPATLRLRIQAILDSISAVADVKFNYVGTFADPMAASQRGSEMNFSLSGTSQYFTTADPWGRGFAPSAASNTIYAGAAGDVVINSQAPAEMIGSFDPGTKGYTLLLHQVLHALGMRHVGEDVGGGRPMTLAEEGYFVRESLTSIQGSYWTDGNWTGLTWHAGSPQIGDTFVLQGLYGANASANAGDTVHALTHTNVHSTIWDASGRDTIDVSGEADFGWLVHLPNYTFSSMIATRGGWAIPGDELWLPEPKTLAWLAGDIEDVIGSIWDDELWGNDLGNSIWGGAGSDAIYGGGGEDFIRGEDGDDEISGGDAWDDLHGNKGNDFVWGERGIDWVVGGQGNDHLYGGEDGDLVLGNMGNDVLQGGVGADYDQTHGDGNDTLRGGQAEDLVYGGLGNDWISGDRGDDTLSGGLGGDIFHSFGGAGLDRVTDFGQAEGDRVNILPGSTYTVSQVGADVVIDVTGPEGAAQMVLAGVQLSSLTGDWIFVA